MNSREAKYRAVAELSMRQAKEYLTKGNYARAFSHFLVMLQLEPELSRDFKEDFVYTLCELGLALEAKNNYSSLFECYERALEVLPNCCELQNNFGAHLLRMGHTEEATIYFLQSLNLNPEYTPAKANLDNAANTLVERWHFPMLNDVRRNVAFRTAIFKAIKKGYSSVLDVGSGTGILSLFATDAGAKEVFACEMSKMMYTISCNVLRNNKVEDKIKLFNIHSTQLSIPDILPNRVNLLITETVDCGLFGEGILQTLIHAWNNLLQMPICSQTSNEALPGKVIPCGATLWASLIESKAIRNQNRIMFAEVGTLKLDILRSLPIADDNPYLAENLKKLPEEVKFLSEPVKILKVNFNDVKELQNYVKGYKKTVTATVTSSGIIDSIVVWFDLHLDEEITISTLKNSCWDQAFFPSDSATTINVCKDSSLNIKVNIVGSCLHLNVCPEKEEKKLKTVQKLENVCITRSQIIKINNNCYWNALIKCLSQKNTDNWTVFDVDNFPLAALIALKMGANKIAIRDCSDRILITALAKANDIDIANIEIISQNQWKSKKWDMIIYDIIESNGLFKEKILEEISLLRHLALYPGGTVIPYAISVKVLAIESETLLHMNRMFDSKTIGCFNIADSVNIFKASFQCDITLSGLPHRQLTDEIEVLYIPIQENSEKDNFCSIIETQCSVTGVVHGLFIWYVIHLTKDISIETTSLQSHWKQYCIVFHHPLSVIQGQKLTLKTKCENSWLTITPM